MAGQTDRWLLLEGPAARLIALQLAQAEQPQPQFVVDPVVQRLRLAIDGDAQILLLHAITAGQEELAVDPPHRLAQIGCQLLEVGRDRWRCSADSVRVGSACSSSTNSMRTGSGQRAP